MEDFTLPNIGASFKKWECCTPILPKFQVHLQSSKNIKYKMLNFLEKGIQLAV
jgi:hypothetical protein